MVPGIFACRGRVMINFNAAAACENPGRYRISSHLGLMANAP